MGNEEYKETFEAIVEINETYSGHQNDQFLDAMTTIQEENSDNVRYIAILDGVLYIPGRKKMYTMITSQDIPVMSALLLRDYLYNLE